MDIVNQEGDFFSKRLALSGKGKIDIQNGNLHIEACYIDSNQNLPKNI